ncbi:TonB-dependent receptor [Hyphomonas sp. ND6WE1B]|uniref:TonB-dependent receptor n=1 Tax=Hyphomonas sp. ND6WE1B TaxID=1848191 RepID=UPI0009F4881E|nr:TonB-dependent receptor [Hyphomonas sp. ND6WE1B]
MSIRKNMLFIGTALGAMAWSGAAVAEEPAGSPAGAAEAGVEELSGAEAEGQGAQAEGDATPESASEPADSSRKLGVVVVTANKREQNLNEVGVTAAVIGGPSLEQQNLTSLDQIATRLPSLSFAKAPNGTPVYTLRGVGFYETSIGAYPSVSIYTDEIPLPFPVMSTHTAFDLERVEVLKGPQGTLFGQNATGGAINFIAAKPSDEFEAGVTATYGRFEQRELSGYVSGPIADGLQFRVAGRAELADGWQKSSSRPGDTNGEVENYMGRAQLAFEPSDSLRFLFNLNGWAEKGETQSGQYIAQQFQNENIGVPYMLPVGAFRDPAILATPFAADNARASDWSLSSNLLGPGKVPFVDNEMFQASLRADFDVGTIGTITSLTGYTEFDQRQGNDTDGMALNALDVPLTLGDIESFFQEIRFANDPANPIRLVVGANYSTDKVSQDVTIDYANSSATLGFGSLFGFPLSLTTVSNSQDMSSYAFFGNVEYDVNDKVTLKGGLRYTKSENDTTICQSDPEGPAYPFGNVLKFFGTLYSGDAFVPYSPGECVSINVDSESPANTAVDYLAYGETGAYINSLDEDNVSWKLGADYRFNGDVLLYANVSKGYKTGSFPTITGSTLNQYVPARQESVLAYEGGIKATSLGGALQVNLAGFYYDYTDKQLRTKLNDPTFGQLDVLRNIPESSVKGVEVEVTARPVEDLVVNAAYTYLDAKVDRFIGTNAGGDPGIDFSGTEIPYTPENQFVISGNYTPSLTSSLNLLAGVTVSYQSDTIATLGGNINPTTVNATSVSCVYCIDGYTLVDAQLGVEASDGRWRAFIWGKNIGDEYYWSNVVSGYDTVARFAGNPRTFGVTLSYTF